MSSDVREQMEVAREVMVRRASALEALAAREIVAEAADKIMEKDREILAQLARR